MRPQLEPSPIIFEFIEIMRKAPVLPPLIRWVQPLFVRAAVALTPPWVRQILGLDDTYRLRGWERLLIRKTAAVADHIALQSSPAVQSCLRLGLPANYLYLPDTDRPNKAA
jgi:uncharacterized protein (DUF2236 family)